jgi:hypothetical protein
MATLRATIEKFHAGSGEYWTNVYHVVADNPVAGLTVCDAIVTAEAAFHKNTVTITKARVDDMVVNTDVYATKVYNTPGALAPGADLLPLFNTVRIDWGNVAGGRPSRKYYRGALDDNDANFTALGAGIQSRMAAFIIAMIGTTFCDEHGHDINSGALFPQVQMRQLRRGSKKKVTPSSGTPL